MNIEHEKKNRKRSEPQKIPMKLLILLYQFLLGILTLMGKGRDLPTHLLTL